MVHKYEASMRIPGPAGATYTFFLVFASFVLAVRYVAVAACLELPSITLSRINMVMSRAWALCTPLLPSFDACFGWIHCLARQEAEEVASQVQGLKQQLGIDDVDQLVEDYPR